MRSEVKSFSVIVPIYKVEEYLPKCIESIIGQTYTDFELILVDDGSPDNCGKICDEYALKDSRIRVIHKENGGLVSARLSGAEAARGEYVCCVDGDDWIAPDYLEKLASEVNRANSDILCVGMILAYPEKQISKSIPYRKVFYDRSEIEQIIFPHLIQNIKAGYFPPTLCAKAIKREIYCSVQSTVDQRIKIGEDGACTIPCLYRAQSLSILPDNLYFYRQNAKSMTKEKKAFSWDGPRMITEHLMRHIDCSKHDFKQQMYRFTVHGLFLVVVSQFNRNEPYHTIKQDILQNLDTPLYREAVQMAAFSDFRAKIMLFALRHRILSLMWIWNRVK